MCAPHDLSVTHLYYTHPRTLICRWLCFVNPTVSNRSRGPRNVHLELLAPSCASALEAATCPVRASTTRSVLSLLVVAYTCYVVGGWWWCVREGMDPTKKG